MTILAFFDFKRWVCGVVTDFLIVVSYQWSEAWRSETVSRQQSARGLTSPENLFTEGFRWLIVSTSERPDR